MVVLVKQLSSCAVYIRRDHNTSYLCRQTINCTNLNANLNSTYKQVIRMHLQYTIPNIVILDPIFQYLPREIILRIIAWKKRIERTEWLTLKSNVDKDINLSQFRAEFDVLKIFDIHYSSIDLPFYFTESYIRSARFRLYIDRHIEIDAANCYISSKAHIINYQLSHVKEPTVLTTCDKFLKSLDRLRSKRLFYKLLYNVTENIYQRDLIKRRMGEAVECIKL